LVYRVELSIGKDFMINRKELPVLVTGFNRPVLLDNTLISLRKFGHENVWIVIDGPRLLSDYQDDLTYRCREVAECFKNNSSGQVLIRQNNLGCKYGMSDAISWFFSHNSKGLVIEDDLIFREDFLRFGYESLNRFEGDESVGSITGFMPIQLSSINRYKLTKYIKHSFFSAWGWGSWSSRWQKYDVEMQSWREDLSFLELIVRVKGKFPRYWRRRFDELSRGELNTWDFQFLYAHIKNKWGVIAPSRNLIQNVGFGESATHTRKPKPIPELQKFEDELESNFDITSLKNTELSLFLKTQFGLH